MLKAYLDDGGAEDQKVMVIGGLLAGDANWAAIESDWLSVEMRDGIGPFHAKAMRTPRGPCASWATDRYVALLKELADVAARRRPIHVGIGIVLDDFRAAISRCNRLRASVNSPFDFCMSVVMQQLATVMNRYAPGESVTIVFDRPRNDLGAAAARCIAAYQASFWNECFESVTFQSRGTCAALRVADFVANDTFKYFRDRGFSGRERKPIFTERAMGRIVSLAKYYDADGWQTLVEMIDSGVTVSQIPIP